MTTTTIPRRQIAPWMVAVAAAIVLIGMLAVSGARVTWDNSPVTVEAVQIRPETATTTDARANRLAAARHELTALRDAARQVPAIRQGMHDHIQLLAAVSAGHVPIEALEPAQ